MPRGELHHDLSVFKGCGEIQAIFRIMQYFPNSPETIFHPFSLIGDEEWDLCGEAEAFSLTISPLLLSPSLYGPTLHFSRRGCNGDKPGHSSLSCCKHRDRKWIHWWMQRQILHLSERHFSAQEIHWCMELLVEKDLWNGLVISSFPLVAWEASPTLEVALRSNFPCLDEVFLQLQKFCPISAGEVSQVGVSHQRRALCRRETPKMLWYPISNSLKTLLSLKVGKIYSSVAAVFPWEGTVANADVYFIETKPHKTFNLEKKF